MAGQRQPWSDILALAANPKVGSPRCTLRWRDPASRWSWPAVALLALFVMAVGVAPHAWFSAHVGELTHFKAAYDEDTYARLILRGQGLRGRPLAALLLNVLYGACGENVAVTLAVADAIFPALAAVSAFALAAVVVRGPLGRILVALLLLFGQELFSFGSSTVTWLLPGPLSLSGVRQALAFHPGLVPDYFTSYFSLYRTPEPQVSLALVFLHLAAVVALVSGRGSRYRPALLAALTVAHAVLLYEYAFLVAMVVAMEALLVVALLVVGRRGEAGWLLVTMTPVSVLGLVQGSAGGPGRLFHSSAPILTPAVIYAVLLLLLALAVTRQRGVPLDPPMLCLAAACAAVPLLLMNQQIVTGVMVSTRDFERYSNYPVLVLAAAILVTTAAPLRRLAAVTRPLLAGGIAVVASVVVLGQWQTVHQFRGVNEASVTMARAIRSVGALGVAPPRVLIEEVELVPLVAVRLHGHAQVEFVLDYTEIIEPSRPDGRGAAASHRASLFEHFARSGQSVADVERLLQAEAATIGTSAGYFLHFLFPRLDVWYPRSDSRKLRPDLVRAALPQIVDDYARFLANPPERLERPVLYVTRGQPPAADAMWSYRALAEATPEAGPRYVAYVQSPRSPRGTGH
jgi:hypothetical protein